MQVSKDSQIYELCKQAGQMKSLDRKVAIVTGGSRGIGAGIALELGKRGANVLITYNSGAKEAEQIVAQLNSIGVGSLSIQATGNDRSSPLRIVEAAVKKWGHIDIIVNNAATSETGFLKDTTHEVFDNVIDCNLRFPTFLVKESLPHLGKAPRIVNISSIAARMGGKRATAYAASKAGLEAVTRVWAQELGQEYNATVNCVNPGPVATDMFYKDTDPKLVAWYTEKVSETPAAPRVAVPDDIAQIVAFLSEEGSRWCTGSTVNANGGMYFN